MLENIGSPVGMWISELPKKSVFIGGLSHDWFYLIAATKPKERGYNAIAIGKFSDNSFKIKFYGGFSAWGLTRQELKDQFCAHSFVSRMSKGPDDEDEGGDEEGEYNYSGYEYAGYDRYFTDLNGLCLLIQSFQGNELGITVANTRDILKSFDIPLETREEMATKFQFDPIGEGMPGLPRVDKAALE